MKRIMGGLMFGVSGLAMAGGLQSAGNAQEVAKQREARAADIAFWTGGYRGADLVSGRFDCPAPAIPELSRTKAQIKSVSESFQAWQQCYNGFVANLNKTVAQGSRIPADVVGLLTPAEAQQAAAHIERVHAGLAAQAQQNSAQMSARFEAWRDATEQFVMADHRARMMERAIASRRAQEREGQQYPRTQPTMGSSEAPPPTRP